MRKRDTRSNHGARPGRPPAVLDQETSLLLSLLVTRAAAVASAPSGSASPSCVRLLRTAMGAAGALLVGRRGIDIADGSPELQPTQNDRHRQQSSRQVPHFDKRPPLQFLVGRWIGIVSDRGGVEVKVRGKRASSLTIRPAWSETARRQFGS